ncbi:hypothetical protein BDW68DRAFT_169220 [Aspergillus falconensis]
MTWRMAILAVAPPRTLSIKSPPALWHESRVDISYRSPRKFLRSVAVSVSSRPVLTFPIAGTLRRPWSTPLGLTERKIPRNVIKLNKVNSASAAGPLCWIAAERDVAKYILTS